MADPIRPEFEDAYQAGDPPWEIGGPQPEIVALAAAGELGGEVLDVGCGTGENALHLAGLGLRVLGIDAAPTAVARAEAKARARGLPAAFRVADALDLRRLHRRFETAIDSGFFHTLDRAGRRAYAHSLTEALSPGSTVHVLCCSDEEPPGPGPVRIADYDLREAFRSLFALSRIRPARLATRLPQGELKAWLATLTRV
jgi:cyclopropane fatty-acyl-phospholipid synthase-like methyltransferase